MSAGLGLVGVSALAAGAVRRLTGGWPLVGMLDEFRLAATRWEELVAAFHRNPRIAPVEVCVTTIPSRMDCLELAVRSLLRQTVRPRTIRIHLPEWSEREGCAYPVPDWLDDPGVFTLVRCPDHGPATKLLPALELPAGTRILVLDDDRIFGPRLVEELAAWSERLPGAILCGSGWDAPEDLVDRPTTLEAVLRDEPYVPVLGSNRETPLEVDVLQGLQGYLARPEDFDREGILDRTGAPEAARWCDDVWISAHARARRVVVPLSRVSTPHWTGRARIDATSLARNFNSKPDPEARSNSVLLRHFADRWKVRRR